MRAIYLINILPTDKESRTLHISPIDANRLGKLKEDIELFRPVGSIVTTQYSRQSIKICFLTASQKEEFINEYISNSGIIDNKKWIAFDDWRNEAKAMINKKFGLGIFDAPITRWRFTARTVHVESETRSLLSFDYARDEGLAYIYGCDNSVDLADVIKRRYPNCRIEYELSFSIDSDDSRLVIGGLTIPEANDFLRHVKPHENPRRDLVVIEFDERDEFAVPPKYSEEYFPIISLPDIPNCVWPKQTFEQTETKTLKAGDTITFDYKIDDSTIYPHVDIKEADEWLDTDKMWDMFIKHYTDEPLSTGVAIVKEEKDMAGYKLKDTHNNLKLYMVEDKPTYTPRGMARGVAKKIDELPEAIRNVQFNEKKGVVTVVWVDGEVTMAKCGPNDIWDPEKGLAIAVMKRWFKSTTSMNKWIKGIIPEGCEAESLMDQLIHLYCRKDAEAIKTAVELGEKVAEPNPIEMLKKYKSVKETTE